VIHVVSWLRLRLWWFLLHLNELLLLNRWLNRLGLSLWLGLRNRLWLRNLVYGGLIHTW
jgi:hypothetical protein